MLVWFCHRPNRGLLFLIGHAIAQLPINHITKEEHRPEEAVERKSRHEGGSVETVSMAR